MYSKKNKMIAYQVQIVGLVMTGCVRFTDKYSAVFWDYSDPSTRNKFVFRYSSSIIQGFGQKYVFLNFKTMLTQVPKWIGVHSPHLIGSLVGIVFVYVNNLTEFRLRLGYYDSFLLNVKLSLSFPGLFHPF
jgi:hypothetical protein